ncbi:MAG: DNA polymerase III subunit alpha [Lentimicrobiaceae bacterium]|nr:DNA polymerase III subunit alpha [Lentimicrobiaceae bacterium]
MLKFTHLHVHSHYSIQDGMAAIGGLVDKAVSLGMNALALTDHGNMFGIKEFFDYTEKKNSKIHNAISELKKQLKETETAEQKQDIEQKIAAEQRHLFKPIFGCEVYVARQTDSNPEGSRLVKSNKENLGGHHLVLLAKNRKGYQNLCKMVSSAWIDGCYPRGSYARPRIDRALMEEYHEGLIACSACLGGELHKKLEFKGYEAAREAALWFKNLFGEDYYIELQRLETDNPNADQNVYEKQKVQNVSLIQIARELDIKLIATNDVHFIEKDHAEAHDRLICLNTGKKVNDKERMRYTKQEWLKSCEEMEAVFSDIPEALENTQEIVDKVAFYSLNSDPIMPRFDIPSDFGTEEQYRATYSHEDLTAEFESDEEGKGRIEKLGGFDRVYRIKLESDYLRKLTLDGAVQRYGENLNDEIVERINFELSVMRNMGYPGYFLIVQDFIRQAREMDVLVGPGRGSAAGSVVSYCLKITNIDPLKYDLLFERFLNPDRISLPDIDIDFDDKGRAKVLNWVTEKYGKDRVAHIITYGTMGAKSSIKDVARVHDVPLNLSEQLAKEVPDGPGVILKDSIELSPKLKEACQSPDPNIASMMKYAIQLEGTVRQTGVHACGVIIAADDLTNFVPLSTAKDTEEDILVTQYEGNSIESIGLVKMDFLGLKNLSIVKDALLNIKKSKGIEIDIDKIPLDDELTYKLYSNGATVGTFQFESDGMQKYLRDLKPTQFEDLIAMNALYRPGPIQYIPQFIRRKHGKERIDYPLPEMEKRLKDTYGITVYQEQVMLLSRDLAGFTRGQSDTLRKAMGKKDRKTLDKMKPNFIEGGVKNGYNQQILEKIWSDWEKFAEYAFNKSHSTCYAMQAYQMGYLKAHYPAEYMAACLTSNFGNVDKISEIIADCVRMEIKVLGPSINKSDAYFAVNEQGEICFGLTAVKGVGQNAVAEIIAERENAPYKSILDFVQRVNLRTCNKRCVESLALAGTFDEFEDVHRAQLFIESDGTTFLEKLMNYASKYQAAKDSMQISLFGEGNTDEQDFGFTFPQCTPWSTIEKLSKEKEVIGFYISGHPLDDYSLEISSFCKGKLSDFEELENLRKRRSVVVAGMVISGVSGLNKNGQSFTRLSLEDYYSKQRDFYLNGEANTRFSGLCVPGERVAVSIKPEIAYGKDGFSSDDYRLNITNIDTLENLIKQARAINITLPNGCIDEDFTAGMEELIRKYLNPKGIGVKFKVVDADAGVDILLSSEEKVDAKPFCRDLRNLMLNDSAIGLER